MSRSESRIGTVKRFTLVVMLIAALATGTLLIYDLFIQTPINLPDFIDESIRIAVIIGFWGAALVAIRRIKPVMSKHFGAQPATLVQIFMGAISILVMTFAVLNIVGVAPENLLAGAGLASITIGLIVSTFVGSVLTGALVFATQKFKVGEGVLINNVPGKVTEISATVTRVKTDTGLISVPNSAIASGAVIITKLHLHENASYSRLPYVEGDRVVTTFMAGEGEVKEITALHTRILLDSGKELTFLNNSVVTGAVAVAKLVSKEQKNSTS